MMPMVQRAWSGLTRAGGLFVAVATVLSACQTDITSRSWSGDKSGVVDSFNRQGASFDALDLKELHMVCTALDDMRQFDPFFKCMDVLERRTAQNQGQIIDVNGAQMNKDRSEARMLSLRANALLNLGDYPQASELAEKALWIADNKSFAYDQGAVMNALGAVLTLGLQSAMDEGVGEAYKTESLIANLGIASVARAGMGDTEKARAWAGRLERLDTSGYFTSGFAQMRQGWLGKAQIALGDYEAAYRALTKEQELSSGGVLLKAMTETVGQLVPIVAAVELGGFVSMEEMMFAYTVEPRFMLHYAELQTGRLADAAKGFDDILADPRAKGYGNIHYLALYGRGQIALKQNDARSGVDYLKRAVDVIEAQRSTIASDRYRMSFVGDKQDIYRDLVDALLASGRDEEAFRYAERAKARALVDLLASKKAFGSGVHATESATLLASLDRDETTHLASAGQTGASGTRGIPLATRRQIAEVQPALVSLVTVSEPETARVQALLAPGETLIEYYGGGDSLHAFVLRKGGIKAFTLDGKGVDDDVRAFRAIVSDPRKQGYAALARALYDRLLKPLEGAISGDAIAVVPHGALHYLPFVALNDGRRNVLQKYKLRMLPSASVLAYLPERKKGAGGLIAFGNPDLGNPKYDLPGAEAEARHITASRAGARLLVRKAASETAAKTQAGAFGYVHFATHGTFDAAHPLTSGLLMAGGGGNDGMLTVGELYDLNLKADLVTLSACETALGKVASGDDVVGLTRGFLFAGARSVIASLWQVDDAATNALMTALYKEMDKGASKRDALRAGQLATFAKFPHPAYWAAFQLTGGI